MSDNNTDTNIPVIGKTYSLYGGNNSSDAFYMVLSSAADEIIGSCGNILKVLDLITSVSTSKIRIKYLRKRDPFFSQIMSILKRKLSGYIVNLDEHLKSITLSQRWDKRLAASEEQYFLYLLEIELTNRINIDRFSAAKTKYAFLPHCLKDFSRECLSAPDDIDYLCKGCSKICTVNKLSRLLKSYLVTPYIWMEADLKKIFRGALRKSQSMGVLGIACIPELANGMRLCRRYNIPVIGIPLDANRCRRWMGSFHFNTVNFGKLEEMLRNQSS